MQAGSLVMSPNIENAGLSSVPLGESVNGSRDGQERYPGDSAGTLKHEHDDKFFVRASDIDRGSHRDALGSQRLPIHARVAQHRVVESTSHEDSNSTVMTAEAGVTAPATSHGKTQFKDLSPTQPDRSNSSPVLGEMLRQHDRVLQISQNATVNQMEAQAVMIQQSGRIDQLMAQQRQLQANWRKLRMEEQNRTQQNMGGM